MINFDIPFVMLHMSTLLVLLLFIFILRMKNKTQMHFAFLSSIGLMLIWSIGDLLAGYTEILYHSTIMLFVNIYFFGVCFVGVVLLFIGIIFVHTKINFSWKHLLLFIPPLVSYILVITNQYHHTFFKKYSLINNEMIWGASYTLHTIFSYIYILVGLYYLVSFSIKNSGFFSRQSILIFIGSITPFIVNIVFVSKIVSVTIFATPIAFSVTIICFAFAILKFDFLNIVPVALQNVVDQISDSYVVINEELEIIDYNKTFVDTFTEVFLIKRKETLQKALRPEGRTNNVDSDKLTRFIFEAIDEKKTIIFEKQIISGSFDKYFTIEITPIIKNDNHLGTIILMKDITQHKKDMELVKQTQNQLMQRDRLASLGELAGGVAHDINSPLSAIMVGMAFIERLFNKYRDSFNNENITPEKQKEMEEEILHQVVNCSNASQKIVKIVNSIRNHTRNLSGENIQDFYVSTVFEDIKILLNHQIKSSECELSVAEEDKILINGDPGKLGQVITNLVVNALQAYAGKPGKIELKSRKESDNVIITIEDNAGGISEMFRDGIFSKMLTTKGTQGTGLGLYLSYSIVTGHFGGKMWFETEEGKGTKFSISIPITKVQTEKLNVG